MKNYALFAENWCWRYLVESAHFFSSCMHSCCSTNLAKMSGIINLAKMSKGQRDKTMADKLICISNDNTQNNLLCRLQLVVETFDTQGHEPTSQN